MPGGRFTESSRGSARVSHAKAERQAQEKGSVRCVRTKQVATEGKTEAGWGVVQAKAKATQAVVLPPVPSKQNREFHFMAAVEAPRAKHACKPNKTTHATHASENAGYNSSHRSKTTDGTIVQEYV